MKLHIKKLGPIDDAELDFGDITVLIGPPNVGKSYTLKALYASLIMLDSTARKSLLKSILGELSVLKRNHFIHEENMFVLLTNLAILYKIDPEKTKNIVKRISNIIKIDVRIENNTIVATSKRVEELSLQKLVEHIRERSNYLWNILPATNETKVNMKLPIPNLVPIITEAFRKPLIIKEEDYNRELKIFIKYVICTYTQQTKLIFERTAEIRLDIISPLIKKKFPKNELLKLERAKDTRELLKILNNLKLFKLTTKRWIMLQAIPEMIQIEEHEKLQDQLAEKIGKMIELIYRKASGIQSVLFIPFGRSPTIYQLEYISREPILRQELFENYYEFDVLLRSYLSTLSVGRSKLSEDRYNIEIAQLFEPVLQGNLEFDKQLGELRYKRWGFKEINNENSAVVPMKWASALAGEVAGILLPILAVPDKSYIIIEEPESQLHYSAQVLMALALIGLSKRFNHKIAFSTHSDVFALTLAYVQEFKPDKNKVIELIKKLLEIQNIKVDNGNLEPLAKAVSENTDVNIKFYYYKPTSKGVEVFEKRSTDILKDVPSITDVVNILATWAMSL